MHERVSLANRAQVDVAGRSTHDHEVVPFTTALTTTDYLVEPQPDGTRAVDGLFGQVTPAQVPRIPGSDTLPRACERPVKFRPGYDAGCDGRQRLHTILKRAHIEAGHTQAPDPAFAALAA